MSAAGPSNDNHQEAPLRTGNPYTIDYKHFLTLYKMMSPAQQVATMNRLSRQQYNEVFHEVQKPRPK